MDDNHGVEIHEPPGVDIVGHQVMHLDDDEPQEVDIGVVDHEIMDHDDAEPQEVDIAVVDHQIIDLDEPQEVDDQHLIDPDLGNHHLGLDVGDPDQGEGQDIVDIEHQLVYDHDEMDIENVDGIEVLVLNDLNELQDAALGHAEHFNEEDDEEQEDGEYEFKDYKTILNDLAKDWIQTEIDHRVSMRATNSFWSINTSMNCIGSKSIKASHAKFQNFNTSGKTSTRNTLRR